MLKGQETPELIIAALIMVAFVVFLFSTTIFERGSVTASLATESKNIQVVDAAHLAKKCFSDGDVVKESSLTEQRFNDCGFPVDILIGFRDLETQDDWRFGKEGSKIHRMYVPLERNNGEVHISELHVEI